MSDNDAILSKITEIFHDVVEDDVVLTRETTASDVPEWDSLSHVRLILAIERGFKVKFSASQISRLKTVGDLVDLIAEKAP
jgi:acyl carrier protein